MLHTQGVISFRVYAVRRLRQALPEVYMPYMWLQTRSLKVTSRFRVDISIANYWPSPQISRSLLLLRAHCLPRALIADKLGPDGFGGSPRTSRG